VSGLLDAALAYGSRGSAVFPCWPRSKAPACLHGLYDASSVADQIRRWWSENAAFNIGVPTGVAFDVVDLDSAEAAVWAGLCGLPEDAPIVRTAKGLHVYLRPTGSGNRTALRPGVDYRGRGGYVVGAGSIHPTGQRYELVAGDFDHIPAAPSWLRTLLSEQKSGTDGAARTAKSLRSDLAPGETRDLTARSVASLRAMAARLAAQTEGNRNALLFWAACTAADTGISQSDVEVVLRDAAQRAGLRDLEITRTLRSAFGRWT
jgi:hypothetical protein